MQMGTCRPPWLGAPVAQYKRESKSLTSIAGNNPRHSDLLGYFISEQEAERRATAFSALSSLPTKIAGSRGKWGVHVLEIGPTISSGWQAFLTWGKFRSDGYRQQKAYEWREEVELISRPMLSLILGRSIDDEDGRIEDCPRLHRPSGTYEESHGCRFLRIRESGALRLDHPEMLLDLRQLIYFAQSHMPAASTRTALCSAVHVLRQLGFVIDADDLRLGSIGHAQTDNLLIELDEELARDLRALSTGGIVEVECFASYREAYIQLALNHDEGFVIAGMEGWLIAARRRGLLGEKLVMPRILDQICAPSLPDRQGNQGRPGRPPESPENGSAWIDEPFSVRLNCGTTVSVISTHYDRTYGGLLEGQPGQKVNAFILKGIKDGPTHWGVRKSHFIEPLLDWTNPSHPRLPPVVFSAWLTSNHPLDPRYCGSELVVTWLTDECHFDSMSDIVARAVRGLTWRSLAGDFDY